MRLLLRLVAVFTISISGQLGAEASTGLVEETMLHPMDAFTGFTLKKNEFIYNQSPFTLPLPSWMWFGITDWLTAEIDTLPLVGGLFQKPFLPVPSFNFRFRLVNRRRFALAYETMYQYLWESVKQSNTEHFYTERKGASYYNRLNASVALTGRTWLHLSAGATQTQDALISNKNRSELHQRRLQSELNPDASLSLDWRWQEAASLHTTASYGTTFVYLDNIPRKVQFTYGARLAPWYNSKHVVLKNTRAEFVAFVMHFPDAKETDSFLFPIVPYFYWQTQF